MQEYWRGWHGGDRKLQNNFVVSKSQQDIARAYLRRAESRYKRLLYNAGCSIPAGKFGAMKKEQKLLKSLQKRKGKSAKLIKKPVKEKRVLCQVLRKASTATIMRNNKATQKLKKALPWKPEKLSGNAVRSLVDLLSFVMIEQINKKVNGYLDDNVLFS